MKILAVGDIHMNQKWARVVVNVAERDKVDAIFQVGDFGFSFDYYFLKPFQECSMPVYWIPGNHENYEFLLDQDAFRGPDEMKELWPNIWHVPRCHTWDWDGKSFAACGGAYSVDKDSRTTYVSYWPEETIENEDLRMAKLNGRHVDYFFSHDVPFGVPSMEEALSQMDYSLPERHVRASRNNRHALRLIIDHFTPNQLIHGHMHVFYEDVLKLDEDHETAILGLNCDETRSNMVILNTETGQYNFPDIENIIKMLYSF